MQSSITDITHVIQLSVTPAFLLVAMGTLLTILNTRLNRIVDRRRVVQGRSLTATSDAAAEIEMAALELAHLRDRSTLVYFAILSAISGALLVCLVVAGTFTGALLSIDLSEVVAGLFVLAMLAMIISWSLLLREVYLAVRVGTHQRR